MTRTDDPPPRSEPLVEVTRGRFVESLHRGSVVVVGASGRLLASAGDPGHPVVLRSSAKPYQLVPFVAAGGERRFGLDLPALALAAASHSGEPVHVATAAAMLARGGFDASSLRCGPHAPLGAAAAAAMARRGERPTALHNNCSGKHAAMLLACRLLELDPGGYFLPEHPLQRRILSVLARAAGLAPAEVGIAVDGCAVPVFRMPLYNLALAYARLRAAEIPGEPRAEAAARSRVVAAMTGAPEMVGGTGRFTTRVMRLFGGTLVAKEGAEAVYAMSAATALAGEEPVGIALKVEDGGERARDVVSVEALLSAGLVPPGLAAPLRRLAPRAVRNSRGDVVGTLRPVLALRRFGPPPGGPRGPRPSREGKA